MCNLIWMLVVILWDLASLLLLTALLNAAHSCPTTQALCQIDFPSEMLLPKPLRQKSRKPCDTNTTKLPWLFYLDLAEANRMEDSRETPKMTNGCFENLRNCIIWFLSFLMCDSWWLIFLYVFSTREYICQNSWE